MDDAPCTKRMFRHNVPIFVPYTCGYMLHLYHPVPMSIQNVHKGCYFPHGMSCLGISLVTGND